MNKPILVLDFDGVINPYSKGWQDGELYETDVTEGFWDWLLRAAEHFQIYVYSSRSKDYEKRILMQDWMSNVFLKYGYHTTQSGEYDLLLDYEEEYGTVQIKLTFAHEKPAAFLTIDDRAITFDGRWDDLDPVVLRDFKPWNVK